MEGKERRRGRQSVCGRTGRVNFIQMFEELVENGSFTFPRETTSTLLEEEGDPVEGRPCRRSETTSGTGCTDTDYFARRGRDAEWKDPRGEN